jgi:hypothetical protein
MSRAIEKANLQSPTVRARLAVPVEPDLRCDNYCEHATSSRASSVIASFELMRSTSAKSRGNTNRGQRH